MRPLDIPFQGQRLQVSFALLSLKNGDDFGQFSGLDGAVQGRHQFLFYLQSEQQIEAYIEGLRRAGISD